jgi:hypothetical protein
MCISAGNCYIRGDLTMASYYSTEELAGIFCGSGFAVERNEYEKVHLVNRKQRIPMLRVWLNGKFRKLS